MPNCKKIFLGAGTPRPFRV